MLSSVPEVDIVVIATPSGMHYEHAKEIIEKFNKHVVVEKPTFMRHDQLNEIYSIATKKIFQYSLFFRIDLILR